MPFITNVYSGKTFWVPEYHPCGNCEYLEIYEEEYNPRLVDDYEYEKARCEKWNVELKLQHGRFGHVIGAYKDRRCSKIG